MEGKRGNGNRSSHFLKFNVLLGLWIRYFEKKNLRVCREQELGDLFPVLSKECFFSFRKLNDRGFKAITTPSETLHRTLWIRYFGKKTRGFGENKS